MVVAMFSCTGDMQAVLDALWEYVLPAVHTSPLDAAAHSAGDEALAERMANLEMATAAERTGGSAPGPVPVRRWGRNQSEPSHITITSLDTRLDHGVQTLTVHERGHDGDSSFTVVLSDGWIVDEATATSAALLADGRIVVDIVFLHTPHRLEIELDPASETFVARWPLMPLFGVGADAHLAGLRSLPD
jgi:hypothetical protein